MVLGATTFKGLGTLNAAAGVYVAGHGTVAQAVRDTEAAYTTLGTILPADHSIPQTTEGSEILSVAITPTNASSILRIRVNLMVGHASAGGQVCAALFVDSSVGALAAAGQSVGNSTTVESLSFEYTISAGSTSARTYKVRAGSDAASDAFLNGNASSRIFGGVAVSSLEVEEVLPQ